MVGIEKLGKLESASRTETCRITINFVIIEIVFNILKEINLWLDNVIFFLPIFRLFVYKYHITLLLA